MADSRFMRKSSCTSFDMKLNTINVSELPKRDIPDNNDTA